MTLKIWLVNNYFVPLDQPGGTRHYFLAKGLVERGHSVTIIASNYNHYTRKYIHNNTEPFLEDIDGIKVWWIPSKPYQGSVSRLLSMLRFSWSVWRSRKQAQLDAPDVIFSTSPHLFSALSSAFIAKKKSVPFVLEIRDLWPESLIEIAGVSPWHPIVLLMKVIESYCYRAAKHIITLLPAANQYIAPRCQAGKPIKWLPNFIDYQMVSQYLEPQQNDKFIFIYSGSHGVANYLDVLIDAAAKLEKMTDIDYQIQLIGDGAEKAKLQQQVAKLGLKKVVFFEPVPKKEIYSLLQQADAYVLVLADTPLYRWGISLNKLYDYMAMGKPVVFVGESYNNPIRDLQSGMVVEQHDTDKVAQAMLECIKLTSAERAAMGKKNGDFIKKHHDLPVIVEQLEGVLQQCIAN